jgi:hypothetical protein
LTRLRRGGGCWTCDFGHGDQISLKFVGEQSYVEACVRAGTLCGTFNCLFGSLGLLACFGECGVFAVSVVWTIDSFRCARCLRVIHTLGEMYCWGNLGVVSNCLRWH